MSRGPNVFFSFGKDSASPGFVVRTGNLFLGSTFLGVSFSAALDGRNKRNFYILVGHLTTLGRKGNERPPGVTLHNERTSMHNQVHVDVTVFLCRVAFIVSVSTDLHG